MDAQALLTGGGVGGILVALAVVGRLMLDAWKTPKGRRSNAVADAAEANATLVQTLTALQAENTRLSGRVSMLEDEAEAKDRKIDELEGRLNIIAAELAALKTH